MTQRTMEMSMAIRIVTSIVIALTAAFFVSAFYSRWALIPAAAMAIILLGCYLTAPVSYELDGDRLTVFTHVGSRTFAPVVQCSPVERKVYLGIRLFGNGGLFAGTGWYWSRHYGIFRAYVTSARVADMLMVETPNQKVLISPEDPPAFLSVCGSATVPAA